MIKSVGFEIKGIFEVDDFQDEILIKLQLQMISNSCERVSKVKAIDEEDYNDSCWITTINHDLTTKKYSGFELLYISQDLEPLKLIDLLNRDEIDYVLDYLKTNENGIHIV